MRNMTYEASLHCTRHLCHDWNRRRTRGRAGIREHQRPHRAACAHRGTDTSRPGTKLLLAAGGVALERFGLRLGAGRLRDPSVWRGEVGCGPLGSPPARLVLAPGSLELSRIRYKHRRVYAAVQFTSDRASTRQPPLTIDRASVGSRSRRQQRDRSAGPRSSRRRSRVRGRAAALKQRTPLRARSSPQGPLGAKRIGKAESWNA
jgi:hypothetical protein